MGGGQAGAPADDDHVPWSRPPRRGHRDRGWSRRGPALAAGPVHVTGPERADARLRPKRPMGGAGAKRLETEEGLTKSPTPNSATMANSPLILKRVSPDETSGRTFLGRKGSKHK